MESYILVALGGAIGSVGRFGISQIFSSKAPTSFPWATLLINLVGCLLIGLIVGLAERYQVSSRSLRCFFIVGICGGFTTFSAFSLEALNLFQASQNIQAIAYVLISIVLGLALTFCGYSLMK